MCAALQADLKVHPSVRPDSRGLIQETVARGRRGGRRLDESREQVKGAKRDKINSNPGLGCPEPQITSRRYIHRGSSLFDDDQPLTRLYSLPVIPLLIQCPPRDDSDVFEIRFQKTRDIPNIAQIREISDSRMSSPELYLDPRRKNSRTRLIARSLIALIRRHVVGSVLSKLRNSRRTIPSPPSAPPTEILIIFMILYRGILRKGTNENCTHM